MKLSLYIFLLLLAFAFQSCDLFNIDNDPMLPEITQEGKGTFGCLIAGELFLPKGPDPTGGMRGNPHAILTEVSGTTRFKAQNTDSWSLSISAFSVFTEGVFDIRETGNLRDLTITDCKDYKVDTSSASVTIQFLDKEEDIISGIFSGQFINECDSTDVISITDGRFDLIYTL